MPMTNRFKPEGAGRPILNLEGRRWHKLEAIKFLSTSPKKGAKWLFKCDCGGEREALAMHVKRGTIKSCGCMWEARNGRHREEDPFYVRARRLVVNWRQTGHPLFPAWEKDWDALANWLRSKLHEYPAKSWRVERLDKTRGWFPDNLHIQFDHTPPTPQLITAYGQTKTVWAWSQDKLRCKVGYSTLLCRWKDRLHYYQEGWSNEQILHTPSHKLPRKQARRREREREKRQKEKAKLAQLEKKKKRKARKKKPPQRKK